MLWLCFLIPGLIYSIWRRSGNLNACPSCGQTSLIPLFSPGGKELILKQGKTTEEAEVIAQQSLAEAGREYQKDRIKLVLVALLVVVIMTYITGSN